VQPDEEHQPSRWRSRTARSATRGTTASTRTSSTGEYRTLARATATSRTSAADGRRRTLGAPPPPRSDAAEADGAERHRHRRRAARRGDEAGAEPKPSDDASSAQPGAGRRRRGARIESLDELVEFFIAAGKKGVAINRYKGLGEMNPDSSGRRR
jgi:DNA gyrase/topoisomerase IV subunit B